MVRSWNACDPLNPDPFSTWIDNLAQAFVRLESELLDESPFVGAIQQSETGPIRISRVTASPNSVHRRRKHINEANDDVVFVNLQTFGIGVTRQHGREIRTAPFDIATADTMYPFDIGHASRFSLFSITVPRRDMPIDLLKEGCLHLSQSRIGRDIARMIANYSALTLDPQSNAAAGEIFGKHIIDLLTIAVSERRGWDAAARKVEIDIELLQDFVRQNFRDPCLSAASVAGAFGISERYVHKLFAKAGQTFSEYVCAIRLEQCALALGDAAWRSRSIADIAYEAGFSDLSYFNRRFKSRFGDTPSAHRRDWRRF
jgi:AraC-like DNA-binding protein